MLSNETCGFGMSIEVGEHVSAVQTKSDDEHAVRANVRGDPSEYC